jgi:hypothetical protein
MKLIVRVLMEFELFPDHFNLSCMQNFAGTNFKGIFYSTYSSGTRNRSNSDFTEITKRSPE